MALVPGPSPFSLGDLFRLDLFRLAVWGVSACCALFIALYAATTEIGRPEARVNDLRAVCLHQKPDTAAEAIASVVENALQTVPCVAVIVPTRSGTTARMISRFKPAVWTIAVSPRPAVCQSLVFSYGVHPVDLGSDPEDWPAFATAWLREQNIEGQMAMLVAGPSPRHPEANHRIEFMRLNRGAGSITPDPVNPAPS
jgi:pyruvate kinase